MPRAALAFALLLAAASARAQDTLVAERLDPTNFAALSPGGADATGGIGDWALSNGTLCAVIADPAHESDLATGGGALVDLGHCGRGDDQIVLVQPLVNLDRRGAVAVERVEAGVAAGVAHVTSFGRVAGCDVETAYELDRTDPARLRVRTRLTRREPGDRVFALADIALHAQHALRPFALDVRGRVPADGFAHPPLDLASPLSVVRATRPADVRVLVGAAGVSPEIAYALRATRAERLTEHGAAREALAVVSLSAENFSGFAAFAAPFWTGADRLGALQIAQTLFMDVDADATLEFEREILVSRRADVASLTDRIYTENRRVRGRLADPGARVAVRSEDGRVATEAVPAEGAVAFAVPRGRYALTVSGAAGGETHRAFEVADADVDLGSLDTPPVGRVALPRGHAMRLAFVGLDGTPDPRFGEPRPSPRFGDDAPPGSLRTRDVSLAGVASDPAEVVLAPGRYRVIAGRGLEYGIAEAELTVRAGETATLAIEPPARALDTPGWIGADLHVHAAPSDDSALPLDLRIATFAAEGVEVLVATDHDHLTDYGPRIRTLGLASQVASVVGQEITSSVATDAAPFTFGHANAFPLPYRADAYRKGAIANEGRRLRQAIDAVRALGGERLVQLNHARSGGDQNGFFDHLSVGHAFEPDVPLAIPPNAVLLAREPATGTRDLDFDALEILNGASMERYRLLREDWFSLLRQGEVRTATANSDSHILDEPVGAPRTWVRLEGDTPERFDPAAMVAAIRAGRVIGSTGPVLDLHVGDAGLGETHRGREGAIRVDVHAAPWVPVSRVRAFVNGTLAHETDTSRDGTVWFPHTFERDAFVTVEVEGAAAAGSAYAERYPDFTSIAFSNPVFVDADGDGQWSPPGLRPSP